MIQIPQIESEHVDFIPQEEEYFDEVIAAPDVDESLESLDVPSPGVLNAWECDTPPRLLEEIVPYYPEQAMLDGAEGKVILELVLNELGRVENTMILESTGRNDLDRAAEQAAKRAVFSPARHKNRPVEVIVRLTLDFTLQ